MTFAHPTRDILLDIARKLPPAAQILAGICEMLHDVNTDLDQIAGEIRKDAALAARVIRISNSVVYGGAGGVATVEEAVGRVGFAEIVRLVGTATVNRIASQELKCYHVSLDLLREALLMHGLAAEITAEHLGMNRNTAYISGLLRGLGTMVLDRFGAATMPPNLTYDPSEFETYTKWELTRFGVTSTSVTTMALDDWHFPEEVVTAVELHLAPPPGIDEAERLATVLNLAGSISVEHGRALPGDVLHWTSPAELADRLGLGEWEYRNLIQRAATEFELQKPALY